MLKYAPPPRFVNQPARENAPVVDRLIEEGAIPFTKTNVPQSYASPLSYSNPPASPIYHNMENY